ncbi:hypothetical protein H5410_012880 [Solanum commersonii]|uniref:Uncharacterized protein n=1 Tax=Solanum commersonii TaxID=4109 RepID=A0A9J6ASX6_SOLCO|nr:hypothetical protein H5410_012880 [Solanum commersonii]
MVFWLAKSATKVQFIEDTATCNNCNSDNLQPSISRYCLTRCVQSESRARSCNAQKSTSNQTQERYELNCNLYRYGNLYRLTYPIPYILSRRKNVTTMRNRNTSWKMGYHLSQDGQINKDIQAKAKKTMYLSRPNQNKRNKTQ